MTDEEANDMVSVLSSPTEPSTLPDDKPFRRGHRIDRISTDKPMLGRASRDMAHPCLGDALLGRQGEGQPIIRVAVVPAGKPQQLLPPGLL